jgi:DNA modification methylase
MNYELHLQDCIDWMNAQPEKSIPCIITSPPYNLDIKYGTYQDDLPRDGYLKWLRDVAVAMKRVLTEDGQLFLNVYISMLDRGWYLILPMIIIVVIITTLCQLALGGDVRCVL